MIYPNEFFKFFHTIYIFIIIIIYIYIYIYIYIFFFFFFFFFFYFFSSFFYLKFILKFFISSQNFNKFSSIFNSFSNLLTSKFGFFKKLFIFSNSTSVNVSYLFLMSFNSPPYINSYNIFFICFAFSHVLSILFISLI